ncbi:MAG: anaerobic ribonucleoside-triphosphate reductase activating protein [Thermoplasmata archaeon]|nr:MAG: anaerobic ribonucleoside-triphosphate reductase activating protein [Thermoplasmata archaeon]
MNIGGFQETSLLDYPGKVAAIIWTTGCNFRCPFCYNPDLVFEKTDNVSVEHILSFLDARKGKIDALSISGGEPFLQRDLKDFILQVKNRGYLVKVDTNGSFPDRLKEFLDEGLIDYLSMDVKATKNKYKEITGVSVDIDDISTSIGLIKDYAADYEFKTTVIPKFHQMEDIVEIAGWLKGSKKYFLQQFKSDTSIISSETFSRYSKEELLNMCELVKPYFEKCHVRGV